MRSSKKEGKKKITTQIIPQIYANISDKKKRTEHKHATTKNNEIKIVVVCCCYFFLRCKNASEQKKREHIHTKKRTVQHRL